MKKKNNKKTKTTAKPKMFVMFGFEEAEPENTAFLKIETDGSTGRYGIYSIVNSAEYATKFPEADDGSIKGFGTPYQWAEFFAEEEDLQDWNFHPVPYSET